jgi:hypothetical protein
MRTKNNVSGGLSSRAGAKILLATVFLCFLEVFLEPMASAAAQDEWSRLELEWAQEERALGVNEGELQLLDQPPEVASHFHHTRLLIREQSLRTGWVTMYQCHSDLDKVASSQIVYQPDRISNIRVLSSQNIGSVWVEGHTVQMKGIATGSKICISADRKALSNEEGRYHLKLGPFIRRFLDGYYPMHVRVEVCYPNSLELVSSRPVKALQHAKNETRYADIDVWVVGELNIELVFVDDQPH